MEHNVPAGEAVAYRELINGQKHTVFNTGKAPRTGSPSVTIRTIDYRHVRLLVPDDLSFHELARTFTRFDEDQFFHAFGNATFSRWSRDGNIIRLVATEPIPTNRKSPVLFEERTWDFDMNVAAMVTYYKHVVRRPPSAGISSSEEEVTTRWRNRDGIPLPVSRTMHTSYDVGGARSEVNGELTFLKYEIDAVNAGDLSIDRMGVPTGTPVADFVQSVQWRYFNGAGSVIDGRKDLVSPLHMTLPTTDDGAIRPPIPWRQRYGTAISSHLWVEVVAISIVGLALLGISAFRLRRKRT
jgi:hypothetical protein